MKGSIAIEASFIYPILIVFMFFTILYNFYIHDKVSAKANAYSKMIQSYFNEKSLDKESFENSLENYCFLSDNYSCSYSYPTNNIYLTDKYGHSFCVSFSSYERCKFIREYYCAIIQIISKNSRKE